MGGRGWEKEGSDWVRLVSHLCYVQRAFNLDVKVKYIAKVMLSCLDVGPNKCCKKCCKTPKKCCKTKNRCCKMGCKTSEKCCKTSQNVVRRIVRHRPKLKTNEVNAFSEFQKVLREVL